MPKTTSLPESRRDTGNVSDAPGRAMLMPSPAAGRALSVGVFMVGLPMKRATNSVSGLRYRSIGAPTCSIWPLFITTMRSASVMASTWSCVT